MFAQALISLFLLISAPAAKKEAPFQLDFLSPDLNYPFRPALKITRDHINTTFLKQKSIHNNSAHTSLSSIF